MKFNGMTNIELEMMKDEIEKALPAAKMIAKPFAELTKVHFDELKAQGFDDKQAMYMAVQSTGKQMGLS